MSSVRFRVKKPGRRWHPALERLLQRDGNNKLTGVRFPITVPDGVATDVRAIRLNEQFLNALTVERGAVVLQVPTRDGTLIIRAGEKIHSKVEALAVIDYLSDLGCIERA